jgi:hypothetical protein
MNRYGFTLSFMDTPIPLPERVAAEVRAEMAWQLKSVTHLATALGLDRKATKLRYDGKKPLTLDEVDRIAIWLDVPRARLLVGTPARQAMAS